MLNIERVEVRGPRQLTIRRFQRVIETNVAQITIMKLEGLGYTLPVRARESEGLVIPQFEIFIAERLSDEERAVTLAHEVIHIGWGVFGDRMPYFEDSIEEEAQRFYKRNGAIVNQALSQHSVVEDYTEIEAMIKKELAK